MKSPEQGAATTVWAAVGKEWENKGGKCLKGCEEAKRSKDDKLFGVGFVPQTSNLEQEEPLWKGSLKLAGIDEDK